MTPPLNLFIARLSIPCRGLFLISGEQLQLLPADLTPFELIQVDIINIIIQELPSQ